MEASYPQMHEKEESITLQGETLETLLEKVDGIQDHGIQQFNTDSCGHTQETHMEKAADPIQDNGQTQEDTHLDQKQNMSIPHRIDDLSTKIQVLRKEHVILSEEVKGLIAGSFPGIEMAAAIENLGTKYETLRKKYLEESSERKRLYNKVIELKGNIRVFCRCRPLSSDEIEKGSSSVLDFDPSQETELQIICSDSTRKQFKFDHVFGPRDNQEAVFRQTSPIVTSVLDGFNVCIFAYGQTGTGKTFTMEGTPENRGVNYRTLEELFRISRERTSTMKYELFVSMLEVYNEKIRDLLAENSLQEAKKLEIKQVAEGTLEVPGLVDTEVHSTDEVWELLKAGGRNRAVGSTNANLLSSRSHCLLRVTVRGESLVNGHRSRSHLWLVDLAGSERVGKIEVEGERLKESQCINKSLSALGDVISALASKNSHIPYRNSKLTHLLQSSLGGDCKTLMIVQISPSDCDLGETLCSLNFASRVRGIEHGPARKQSDPLEIFKCKQMAEKLKQDEKESKKMQESLQVLQLKFAAREQLCRNLQEKVRELESQLADERKTRLQQENRAASRDQKGLTSEKKPPLFPSKLKPRPPLSRITNVLPTSGRQMSSIVPTAVMDKENTVTTTAATTNPAPMKARRISMASSIRPLKIQPKRRVSIAVMQPETRTFPMTLSSNTQYSYQNNDAMRRRSLVRDPRRISRIFTPLPEAVIVATTPDNKRNASSNSSRSKFSSPPTQASWRPKLPTVASPRQRRLVSSPLNLRSLKNAQALNKFCSSVQSKVSISPSQQNHLVSRKLGSAQRVLCSNNRRRASIQSFM
ncbi:kinesin-like protein KIN-14S isoform X1 [Cinnamomum micranthum f. kanehirae]|uniref:Kinesin-like protein n=1 Tax=Cinnamomum micranthum f. kanehirae TaxID=337451 RepID=A0A443NDT2_9MAGN|nr:kinesin-like protein KIN-14S isoform X1 [Cinnamomum micranthum f. kanehirae]